MKQKRLNRLSLARPADALLPLGFLIASLVAPSPTILACIAFALGVALISLASSRGVRIAFATQPSMKKVCGSVKTALLLQLCASALGCAALKILDIPFDRSHLALLGAGLMINIEHTFYEYLYATGDGGSSTMTRTISTALVTAGLILTASRDGDATWLFATSGIAAAVSVAAGLLIGGPLKGRLNAQVLRCAPRAILQTFLFPAVAAAICHFSPFKSSIASVFPGLALYELCKTPFRRSVTETRGLNRALLMAIAVSGAAIGVGLVPAVRQIIGDSLIQAGIMMVAAAACSFLLFGNLKRQD